MSATIPRLDFDSTVMPPGDGFRAYSQSVDFDVTLPPGKTPEGFRTRMQAWRLGDMLVTAGLMSEMCMTRSAERVRRDGRDSLSLMLLTRGHWHGDLDGKPVNVGPGTVCLIDFARPYMSHSSDNNFVLVVMPRGAVLSEQRNDASLHGHCFEGMAGRMLADHFTALAGFLKQAKADDAPVMTAATISLVRACLPETSRELPARATLRQRVKTYIDDNLMAHDLSPAAIARHLSVTRSTLYRALPAAGVALYVKNRRLEAAHAMLANPAEHRNLAEIAHEFGFASHAHFSTAFRRRFGYSPSHARQNTSGAGAGAESMFEYHAWLRALEASEALN